MSENSRLQTSVLRFQEQPETTTAGQGRALSLREETTATLEEVVPEMLDEVLARFQEVGVARILRLADEMVRARLELSATSHLTRPGQAN
jgi:hypothetical protein